ncbi:class I poly(R)-hydroxyalkanoic acid synthase [Sphingomonas sp. KR1UV-12]|uniref:Class I poly(R)-hydroxyalkanoic acid synthase n=1 Tax=Sphingomonas aurea TaxID=3063994 RepID=A0ABT9EMF1_9SPHN|nr:class I poly(R)-hydroxyalkanoic acid synthase [Sphingomonas sp. KR1UV-12]MDP1027973.1 class I poly(R)-hydroxyalkanoic acid synthase [Sphingomonas sp. KR1UV-12]
MAAPRDPHSPATDAPDPGTSGTGALPTLEEIQHWTWVVGRAQQMMMEQGLAALPTVPGVNDPATLGRLHDFWSDSLTLWQRILTPGDQPGTPAAPVDKRFKGDAWREPAFDLVRQSYLTIADHLLRGVDAVEGVAPKQKEQLRFATQAFVDAMSPSNFALTNPEVIERTIETRGENLLKGLQHMMADIGRGQLTHTDGTAFEVGRNLATAPGQVVKRTPLYELIQYAPTTKQVAGTPLVIFPPWINRFYILDLTPEKSFIRWAVDQGLTVFMVSWKSADAGMKDVAWDDYVRAQVDAVDTIRELLGMPSVHAIGYCVAGTTLAATLALLTARGQANKVASATFFTAQVDFADAGDLTHFVDDEQLKMLANLSPEGFLDGRYMAATFNLLRGRDLIWNYVTNNYLLGKDYAPFDLLHWNGDTTNLPSKWHLSYLTDLYRDNLLVKPGALSVDGTPLDLGTVTTPSYVQAGREDHIAPAESVWKLTDHFAGPLRFVLAGSGHIAGVVNPPAAGKYQYWTNEDGAASLADFVAGATETKGSWWPDWRKWLTSLDDSSVKVAGARVPGKGSLPALAPAPGEYVRIR